MSDDTELTRLQAEAEALLGDYDKNPEQFLLGLAEATDRYRQVGDELEEVAGDLGEVKTSIAVAVEQGLRQGMTDLKARQDEAESMVKQTEQWAQKLKRNTLVYCVMLGVLATLLGGTLVWWGMHKYGDFQRGARELNFGVSTFDDNDGQFVVLPTGYDLDIRWQCGRKKDKKCGKLVREQQFPP